jgi:hypothetical protein
MNKTYLTTLCTALEIRSITGIPKRVYGSRGGSLVWDVNTTVGRYATKQLSLDIDLKNQRMITKYDLSEVITYQFSQQGIPTVTAIERSVMRLILIGNIGYLVCH